MATKTPRKPTMITLPVSLEQFAAGLRRLSRSELLTLELLLDKRAMKAINQSLTDEKKGRVKAFRL